MKYLILGGAGVFGVHNCLDLLNRKDTELVISVGRNRQFKSAYTLGLEDKKNYTYEQLHITFEVDRLIDLIEKYKPDVIINYAALAYATSWQYSYKYYDTNLMSIVKLCEYLTNKNFLKKFIQISSSELYGSTDSPAKEKEEINPTSPYAVSKLATDLHLKTLYNHSNFPINIIRPCNCYGPGQYLYRIIPKAAFCAINKMKFPLEGRGTAMKSFMHANDLAESVYQIIKNGTVGEIYNVGVKEPITMREIIEIVAKYFDLNINDFTKITEGRKTEDQRYWIDSSKIYNEMGWLPKISLEDGIADTIKWVEKYNDELKNEPLSFNFKS